MQCAARTINWICIEWIIWIPTRDSVFSWPNIWGYIGYIGYCVQRTHLLFVALSLLSTSTISFGYIIFTNGTISNGILSEPNKSQISVSHPMFLVVLNIVVCCAWCWYSCCDWHDVTVWFVVSARLDRSSIVWSKYTPSISICIFQLATRRHTGFHCHVPMDLSQMHRLCLSQVLLEIHISGGCALLWLRKSNYFVSVLYNWGMPGIMECNLGAVCRVGEQKEEKLKNKTHRNASQASLSCVWKN